MIKGPARGAHRKAAMSEDSQALLLRPIVDDIGQSMPRFPPGDPR